MTGIERLRELGSNYASNGDPVVRMVGHELCDIADQIEREHVSRMRVLSVVTEMERHVSGVEGAEDSPVARWASELREALDGEEHDLTDEDREAIAWVRDHGGLERVKGLLEWVVGHCSTRQQLDFDFWLSGRVMHELGFEEDMADRDEVERRLLARLMPEGMEWPRFEDGEPVRFGDEWGLGTGGTAIVGSVTLRDDSFALNASWYDMGERVKRPAPKVLDADGVEIREKRDVWWICEGDERGFHAERLRVETILPDGLVECSPYNGGTWVSLDPSELYVNKPVPASDGRPLREGEHVWHIETGAELVVKELPKPGEYQAVVVFAPPASHLTSFDPDRLTHERPAPKDTWERLEEDARNIRTAILDSDKLPFEVIDERALDLVRRAKALAERDA